MRITEFSDSIDLTKPIQEALENVSGELKLEIWNEVILPFADSARDSGYLKNRLFIKTFAFGFNVSADQVKFISHNEFVRKFREVFLKLRGLDFYNLLNYISEIVKDKEYIEVNEEDILFYQITNFILEDKHSPCRFSDNFALTLITDKVELTSLNEAMATPFEKTVNTHIKNAATALFSGKMKDCCDEAYTAIESLAKTKTAETKIDFDRVIDKLEIDGALKAAIKNGWGFVSNTARHGQNENKYIYPTMQEAKFVLIFASAVINLVNALEKEK